ncbi:alpha/beta fold hydrolase [Cohnella boryungensis]|uniref:Alpha/beta fold hydrolase n=1 Tax=Cohnella boryungensis TaxID=768479 RepID=A0ABV8SDY1_9BACL
MKKAQVNAGIIHYRDMGRGQAIVFLHGTLSNGNTWRKVLPLLAERFRCVVPDLPLGGHSARLVPSADLSPKGIAVMLKEFLDSLELDKVILVGNDTGGAYAQVFATMYPGSLSRLVLCNTDAFEIFPPKAFALLQSGVKIPGFTWLMAQLFRYKSLLKTSLVLGLLSHRLTKDQLSDLYVRHFIRNSGVRADFVKVVKGWSPEYTLLAAKNLENFRQPVLILWGADDRKLFPLELGRRLHALFPNASFKLVPDSLTYVQEDQPETFAYELIHFCSSSAKQTDFA